MVRRSWTCCGIGVVIVAFFQSAEALAQEPHFAIGVKGQCATLTRTLKIEGDRTEAPQSGLTCRLGPAINAVYGRWFVGASYTSAMFIDAEGPTKVVDQVAFFGRDVNVEISQLDLAIGYTILPGVHPYLGYLRHRQQTKEKCIGCVGTVELSEVGAGLLFSYPVPHSRWSIYLNAAFIQGFSLQGGFSYAGTRWPAVAALGYSYQRIDYASGEVSCGQPGLVCFRDRDIFAGPTVMAYYTF